MNRPSESGATTISKAFVWLSLLAITGAFVLDLTALSVDLVRNRRLQSGVAADAVGLDFSSDLSRAANVAMVAAVAVGGLVFVSWFYQRYRRLARRGQARFNPLWAVLGWMVPGVNLVLPPAIMSELQRNRPASASSNTGGNALVGLWWVMWGLGACGLVAIRLITPTSYSGWNWWFTLGIAADVALVVSLACAVILVARADRQFA